MRLLSLSLSICLVALVSTFKQKVPTLSVDRTTIHVGESCKLSWKTNSDSAFLTSVGKVESTGFITISPQATSEFVLVTETAGEIHSNSVVVKVLGVKGDSAYPDIDEFSQGLMGEKKLTSYPDFMSIVFKTLQDKLQHKVRGDFLPNRRFHILYTDRRPNPDLRTPNDEGLRQRRIAYAVRIDEPDSKTRPAIVRFEVKTIIDYQRNGESKWRPETNQQIAHKAAEDLKRQLEATQ